MHGASFLNRARNSRCTVITDLWCVFSKPCTKLTLHCNHRSGHLKTEHTESLFLLRRHLGKWPRIKHEKRTAVSAWETWTVSAADGVRCAREKWEINSLLPFETAPFFCVYPVLQHQSYVTLYTVLTIVLCVQFSGYFHIKGFSLHIQKEWK